MSGQDYLEGINYKLAPLDEAELIVAQGTARLLTATVRKNIVFEIGYGSTSSLAYLRLPARRRLLFQAHLTDDRARKKLRYFATGELEPSVAAGLRVRHTPSRFIHQANRLRQI